MLVPDLEDGEWYAIELYAQRDPELSYDDIARETGMRVGDVRTLMARTVSGHRGKARILNDHRPPIARPAVVEESPLTAPIHRKSKPAPIDLHAEAEAAAERIAAAQLEKVGRPDEAPDPITAERATWTPPEVDVSDLITADGILQAATNVDDDLAQLAKAVANDLDRIRQAVVHSRELLTADARLAELDAERNAIITWKARQ